MKLTDFIAYLIVAVAAFSWLRKLYKAYIAGYLADFFLRRKKIGLAMKFRSHTKAGCGGDCH